MNKLFLIPLFSILSFGAIADDMPQPPMGIPGGDRPHVNMMEKMTDEQKACIEKFGCKMPERPNLQEKTEMPPVGEKPEMTDEQKESMECMQKAMQECGIEMPKRPDFPQGPRPEGPKGEMPEPPHMND